MLIRRIAHGALIAALATLDGCARDSATPAVPQGDVTAACAPQDTAALDPDPWAITYSQPLRPLLDSLDVQVATATADRLPALLLARGRAKSAYQPSAFSADSVYAKARPDEYGYNEFGGEWIYNGKDFHDLIERFPSSPLVDDAAYALTGLPGGGECEGSVACVISYGWAPVAEFLRAHPNARQADFAVARALEAFRYADSVQDLRVGTPDDEPGAIRSMVAVLDTVARLQTPPRRTRLLVRTAELWERYADYGRSRAAYKAALVTADASARPCIEARLALLPARWFLLDTAHVISPRRVELHWQPPGVAGVVVINRSTTRSGTGSILARVGVNERTWTDTTALPGTTYWYRIAVDAPGGRVLSNPASATTPTWQVDVRRIAVSTTDHRLYLFGFLSNGFPQILSVSGNGASVDRRDGMIIGVGSVFRTTQTLNADTSDVWLVDGGGVGVLRFHRTGPELPSSLFSALRRGGEIVRLDSGQAPGDLIASVDEPRGMAWVEYRGRVVSMDCVGAASVCWNGREADALLLDATGAVITTVSLPRVEHDLNEFAMAVFAEPRDSSAWLSLLRSARLLHVSRTGATLSELRIGEPAQAYATAFTVDRDRHMLWFTRVGPERANCRVSTDCRRELVQLDMRGAKPEPRVIATNFPYDARLAPDLSGGVWVVDGHTIRRFDGSGRTLFTITLNDR